MSDYATLEELTDRLMQTQQADEGTLGQLLTAASRKIDRSLKVPDDFFAPAPAESVDPTERTVTANGRGYLILPPFIAGSLASVTDEFGRVSLETEYRVTDNWLYATSGANLDPLPGYPYAPRPLTGASWLRGVRYTITARWGWPEIPADIHEACLMIASFWWRKRDLAWAKAAAIDGAIPAERAIPAEAEDILASFKSELIRRGWINP